MRTLFLALALLLPLAANAANPLASDIVGRVVDIHGQPVAGAQVRLTHIETNRELTVSANERGRYHFSNVRPDGTYQISAQDLEGERGFVMFSPRRVLLGQVMRQNFVLGINRQCPPPSSWQWDMSGAFVITYNPSACTEMAP